MNAIFRRLRGQQQHKYAPIGQPQHDRDTSEAPRSTNIWTKKHIALLMMIGTLAALVGLVGVGSASRPKHSKSCDSIFQGYQCEPDISHYWGQYSPFYSVPSEISADIPRGCSVTFAQVLSRHGARDPTESKTKLYKAVVQQLKSNVKTFTGDYAFLSNYEYTLGADELTLFGQQQMVNSGVKFYERYEALASKYTPFLRSSGQSRVVESAQNWTQGYHAAKLVDRHARPRGDSVYPYEILEIPEAAGVNNTLNHEICTDFEEGWYGEIADAAQKEWANIFATPIRDRINSELPGANLTTVQTVYLMDLCPFNTVASDTGAISPFCSLFSEEEWHQYNYYETLNKYYGYSHGNPLGPSQGVGFTNELIARLTSQPVNDHTSTNSTLYNSNVTFPLGRKLYADFTHDNDMTAIFSAMGLYNNTAPLPNNTIVESEDAGGYSAAWTASFASRAYFEKLQCRGEPEELVRVIVNDRVQDLKQCGGDGLGRCKLSAFVKSLGFARSGGLWNQCYV